jgi:hypothetical protein
MAPGFLKELRRRSRASFRTDHSTDTSSEGAASHGTAPSSGSVTPPSIAQQSDPALNLQLKHNNGSQGQHINNTSRPALVSGSNSGRYSVSGMSGLGAPSPGGKQSLPVSPYAPKVHNMTENAWVRQRHACLHDELPAPSLHPRLMTTRCIKKSYLCTEVLARLPSMVPSP